MLSATQIYTRSTDSIPKVRFKKDLRIPRCHIYLLVVPQINDAFPHPSLFYLCPDGCFFLITTGLFPSILGHEAGAIVESVGPGVTTVAPGDHVVPGYTPQCAKPSCVSPCGGRETFYSYYSLLLHMYQSVGMFLPKLLTIDLFLLLFLIKKVFCMSPKTNLCPAIRSTQGRGVMPDGTTRFKDKDGNPIYHFMGCSSFSEYTVLAEISCAKISKEAPLEKACLFGCGVSTGLGAVWNTCRVETGATVAVFGLGAVGLSVIQGAKYAGASRIIAVDINKGKFDMARKLGATDCVDSSQLDKLVQQHIVGMSWVANSSRSYGVRIGVH